MAREALSGVELSLREGETVCLMGASGSGKTTLLRIAAGLTSPTRGRVLLDGARVDDTASGRRRLRSAVGLLFQSPQKQLFAETVEKDVAFGPRNLGLRGQELSLRVREAMQAVGLDPVSHSHRSPFSLSDGEMRRAALAGVLAMKPRFLLLDEPTSGLDAPGRHIFHELVRGLRDRGIGILMATHDWEEAKALADRVEVISKGRIVHSGDVRSAVGEPGMLSEAGLTPPPMARVLALLREKGLDVPARDLSPREAAELIAGVMGGEAP